MKKAGNVVIWIVGIVIAVCVGSVAAVELNPTPKAPPTGVTVTHR